MLKLKQFLSGNHEQRASVLEKLEQLFKSPVNIKKAVDAGLRKKQI